MSDKEINNYIKNTLVNMIDEAVILGPLYTSRDVWGNEVIILKKTSEDKYETINYKLKTYKVEVEFTREDILNNRFFDNCVAAMKEQNKIILDYDNNSDRLYDLVCNQLCDWNTLRPIYDDNEFFKIDENHYKIILVKYAYLTMAD